MRQFFYRFFLVLAPIFIVVASVITTLVITVISGDFSETFWGIMALCAMGVSFASATYAEHLQNLIGESKLTKTRPAS